MHTQIHGTIESLLHRITAQYETVAFLNPNNHVNYPHQAFPSYICFGKESSGTIDANDFKSIESAHQHDWMVLHLSYQFFHPTLKKSPIAFPDAFYFIPTNVWAIQANGEVEVIKGIHPNELINVNSIEVNFPSITLNPLISKSQYIEAIHAIQKELHQGNIYEMNFCIPFIGEGKLNPIKTYSSLNQKTEAPFSCYIKYYDLHIMSASPERFLKSEGKRVISQPIKGSIPRSNNPIEDEQNKQHLRLSEKERAENTMIVDLVRNDLSITAKAGSVKVSEFLGVYTFKNIHQMISTIEAEIDEAYTVLDCLKNAYPMGSMTGAPKYNAMHIIDKYEISGRGPFSGSVYIKTPHGIDSNVLIRTLFYNETAQTVYAQAGSGITIYADAEEEYNECMHKAESLIQTIQTN